VYVLGKNNCSLHYYNSTVLSRSVPRQVKHELEEKRVVRIACGSMFNIVMTDENKLYGWGMVSDYVSDPCEITTFSDKISKSFF